MILNPHLKLLARTVLCPIFEFGDTEHLDHFLLRSQSIEQIFPFFFCFFTFKICLSLINNFGKGGGYSFSFYSTQFKLLYNLQ